MSLAMVSWGISTHADLRQLIKVSLGDGLVGFFCSARSRMAYRFSIKSYQVHIRRLTWPWQTFYPFFCQPILCLFRIMEGGFILHEKGATMTLLSTMKCRQQFLVQNTRMLMHFSALTFPSQPTSSERPAVLMSPQTITEKPPNFVG